MVQRAARGRHRGDPRRGLQPHRRERRTSAPRSAFAGWTTPATTDCAATIGRSTRTTPAAATRSTCAIPACAAGAGQPALLGRRDAGRRLPLRPGARCWAEATTGSTTPGAVLHRAGAGPAAVASEDDRRALGHRPRRLPARRLSRAAGSSGTTGSATPCGASGSRARASRGDFALAAVRLVRLSSSRGGARLRVGQLRGLARRLHAARPGEPRAPTQPANGEDNRDGHGHNHSANFGVEGPTDDLPRSRQRATASSARCWPARCSPRARRCWPPATSSATRQNGNNNPYCQDNATTWIDWSQRRCPAAELHRTRDPAAARALPLGRPLVRRPRRSQRPARPGLAAGRWPGDAIRRLARRPAIAVLGCLIGHPGRAHSPLLLLVNGSAHDRRSVSAGGSLAGAARHPTPARRAGVAGQVGDPRLLAQVTQRAAALRAARPPSIARPRTPRDDALATRQRRAAAPHLAARSARARAISGPAAYHFVDWLVAAGQKLWQILPLGGIGAGNSPYMSTSAFAGNVLLIDLARAAPARLARATTTCCRDSGFHPTAGRLRRRGALPHGAAGTGRCCVCGARHTARTGRASTASARASTTGSTTTRSS